MADIRLNNASAPILFGLFKPDIYSLMWLIMVLATTLTYWLGAGHGRPASAGVAVTAMLVIAFLKAWVVGNYFMETRQSPRIYRILFSAWIAFSAISTISVVLFI